MNLKLSLALGLLSGLMIAYGMLMPDDQVQAVEEVSSTAQQYLMNLSMTQEDSYHLIEACRKTQAPNRCTMFAGAIWAQEGGYKTRHPFGMLRQPRRYKGDIKEKTTKEYVELRVGSFERFWIRNYTPRDYLVRSNYCTDGCEHWIPNVTRFIAGYDSGVIPQEGALPLGTPPVNTYEIARQASIKRQEAEQQLISAKQNETKARGDCIESKQCK